MFGFKKNEKPTLIIEAKDLMEIIKSDYDNDMAFTLIEFSYNEKKYVMGSCVLPANAEECKENISFIFQDRVFESFEEMCVTRLEQELCTQIFLPFVKLMKYNEK